jgi:hypothetical protein
MSIISLASSGRCWKHRNCRASSPSFLMTPLGRMSYITLIQQSFSGGRSCQTWSVRGKHPAKQFSDTEFRLCANMRRRRLTPGTEACGLKFATLVGGVR